MIKLLFDESSITKNYLTQAIIGLQELMTYKWNSKKKFFSVLGIDNFSEICEHAVVPVSMTKAITVLIKQKATP